MSLTVKDKKTYSLVEFLNGNEKECAVVPLIWLIDNRKKCYWPKTRSQEDFDKLVLENEPYDTTWMKYKVHRVLKVLDDYDGIMDYMDIILEHGSTEDDTLDSTEISHKKYAEPSEDLEEEELNTSDSFDSSTRMITDTTNIKCNQKKQKSIINREESGVSSHLNDSENEISEQRDPNFDDFQEHDLSSNEENVNENVENQHPSTSNTSHTDRNKYQNQPSNVNASSSNNMQTSDVEFHDHALLRAETIMFQEQLNRDIIERLKKLTILSEQNNGDISRLSESMSTLTSPTSKPNGLPELPLKNNDDFDKLEELLSEKIDAQGQRIPSPAYTYLKGRLSMIGGTDQKSSIINMLKFLITNELAMTCNWKKQGQNKRIFETTKLREVITDATHLQFVGTNSSDQYIKSVIQLWLRAAKSRHLYNANAKKN